jgi:phage shock protein PspC (stress-responsive transcriptional regulator)
VTAWNERPDPPVGLSRGNRGRWFGGVCAGLALISGLGVGWVRLGFVVAALIGGLGIALYLACWLIIPADGGSEARQGPGEAAVLAQACAGCAGLAALAVVGAVAAVFGFGWIVFGLGAAVLIGVLLGWRRLGPAWALLPVAALTLPAMAVATSGLRLAPEAGRSTVAPRTTENVTSTVYRSGLNTMLVDLRRTTFPATGTVPLRIDAGLRRTIVALPADRCVRVLVHYHINPFAARFTALLTGRTAPLFSDLVLFGRVFGHSSQAPASIPGPVLNIDFSSQGGSLYVRDYPTTVDPNVEPDWPGYQVHPEQRPDTRGVPRRAAQALLRHWRSRRAAQLENARMIDSLMPGPCAPPVAGAQRVARATRAQAAPSTRRRHR